MRVCLVDDESVQIELLKSIIDKWSHKHSITVDIDFYHSSEEMLFESNESYPYDLVILDIQMGKMNGINLAKKIRETDKSVVIAFVSGIADYVYEGYEVQAIRYILKPVKEEKVFDLLNLVHNHNKKEQHYIIASISGEKVKINMDDIIYIESMGHNVIVYTTDKKYEFKSNLSDLYEEIHEFGFIKTHRSFIINLKHVERISKSECELIKKCIVPLSRNSYKEVNKRFIEYFKGVS